MDWLKVLFQPHRMAKMSELSPPSGGTSPSFSCAVVEAFLTNSPFSANFSKRDRRSHPQLPFWEQEVICFSFSNLLQQEWIPSVSSSQHARSFCTISFVLPASGFFPKFFHVSSRSLFSSPSRDPLIRHLFFPFPFVIARSIPPLSLPPLWPHTPVALCGTPSITDPLSLIHFHLFHFIFRSYFFALL